MERAGQTIDDWRARLGDDELRRTATGLDHDDRDWTPIEVPGHWRTSPEFADSDGPVLYRGRTTIEPPGADERVWLVFDGVFHQADVWFDGAYLGDPEGYFAPASFDVTGLARLTADHVVAVEVACPTVEADSPRRTLTGTFQGGAFLAPDWNPGGLWRPVRVERTGPVRIDSCRVLCRDASAERAHLRIAARLDSDRACRARVVTRVGGLVVASTDHSLARGSNELRWAVDVDAPELWWPWSLGTPALTDVDVTVELDGAVSDTLRRRTGLRQVDIDHWIVRVNGERLFVKGIDLGPSRRDLATATASDLAADLALARDAGLDLVRLRGHIARSETYTAADETGMLIWQDLPLAGPIARSARRRAVDLAERAVDLLGHHPSILLWCAHDSPIGPGGGLRRPTWNTEVLDRWVARSIERADETRPVLAHADTPPGFIGSRRGDTRLDVGRGAHDTAHLRRLAARIPNLVRFVTGIGAASERTGPHQADVMRDSVETLRRLKFRPTGGFVVSSLVDAEPRESDAVVDHLRRPRPAYRALAEACRPVIVVADRPAAEVVPGTALALEVHVVSDRRDELRGVRCTASAAWPGGEHRWMWQGDVAADACSRIGMIRLMVPDAPGPASIELRLDHATGGGEVLATNRYEFVITAH